MLAVSSIAELRAIEAEKLPGGRGWPIVDGWVIPDDQYKLYEAGKYNDTPILVGYNSDEGASFTRTQDPKEFINSVEMRYGPFADELLKAYPVDATSVQKRLVIYLVMQHLDGKLGLGLHFKQKLENQKFSIIILINILIILKIHQDMDMVLRTDKKLLMFLRT